MKKNFSILLVVLAFAGCTSLSPRKLSPEELVIQKIITVEKTKKELFLQSLNWVSNTFVSTKSVIDFQDPELGKIIGNGIIRIPLGMEIPQDVHFRFTIEVKDSKARILFENAYFEVTINGSTSKGKIDNDFTMNQRFKPAILNLIDDYEKTLNASSSEW